MLKRIAFAIWRTIAGLARPSRATNLQRLQARGESPDALIIRDATADDIPALARLHVETWNATYAPFRIKGPSAELRERQWREKFANPAPAWFCIVVQRPDGALIGFAQGNASDHPEYAGELNKIYLRSDYQRLGIGRQLLGHVARRFLSFGITSMWLYGDARNPSSRAWVAMGATKTDDDPGNGNYGWRDLGAVSRKS
jgi:GNAT superfamily N-acetyltransferase